MAWRRTVSLPMVVIYTYIYIYIYIYIKFKHRAAQSTLKMCKDTKNYQRRKCTDRFRVINGEDSILIRTVTPTK